MMQTWITTLSSLFFAGPLRAPRRLPFADAQTGAGSETVRRSNAIQTSRRLR